MAEFELNRDTVQFIIEKIREFQTRDDVNFDEEPDTESEDWSLKVSSNYGDDTYFQELKTTIEDLEPDQQISLVALMWLGRGDFSLDEWDVALNHAQENWNARTADYLIGTAMLADYLAEGLEQFDSEEMD